MEETVDYLANAGNSCQNALVKFGVFQNKAGDDEHVFQREVAENNEKAEYDRKKRAKRRKRKENEKEKEEEKVEFELVMGSFSKLNAGVQDVMGEASDGDMRRELEKLQSDMDALKEKFVALRTIDPSQDLTELQETFVDSVENPSLKTRSGCLL